MDLLPTATGQRVRATAGSSEAHLGHHQVPALVLPKPKMIIRYRAWSEGKAPDGDPSPPTQLLRFNRQSAARARHTSAHERTASWKGHEKSCRSGGRAPTERAVTCPHTAVVLAVSKMVPATGQKGDKVGALHLTAKFTIQVSTRSFRSPASRKLKNPPVYAAHCINRRRDQPKIW